MRKLIMAVVVLALVFGTMVVAPMPYAKAEDYATPTLVNFEVTSYSAVTGGYEINVHYRVSFPSSDADKPFKLVVKAFGYYDTPCGYKAAEFDVVEIGVVPPSLGSESYYDSDVTVTATHDPEVEYVYLYLYDGATDQPLNADPLKVGHVYTFSKNFWKVIKNTSANIGPVFIKDKVTGKPASGGTITVKDPNGNPFVTGLEVAEDGSYEFTRVFGTEGYYKIYYTDPDGIEYYAGKILVKGQFTLDKGSDASVVPIREKYFAGEDPAVAVYTFAGKITAPSTGDEIDHPAQLKAYYHDVVSGWHPLTTITVADDGSFSKRISIPGYADKIDFKTNGGTGWTGQIYYPYPAIKVDAPDVDVSLLTTKLYDATKYNGDSQSVTILFKFADGHGPIGLGTLSYTWYDYDENECGSYEWTHVVTDTANVYDIGGGYAIAFISVPNSILNGVGSIKLGLNYLIDSKVRYDLSVDEWTIPVVYPKGLDLSVDFSNSGVGEGTATVAVKVLNRDDARSDYRLELYGAYLEVPPQTTVSDFGYKLLPIDKDAISDPSDLVYAETPYAPCTGYLLATASADIDDGILTYTFPYVFREGGYFKYVLYARVVDSAGNVIYETSFQNSGDRKITSGGTQVFGYQVEGMEDITVGEKVDLKVRVFDPFTGEPINNAKVVLLAYDYDGNSIAFSKMFPGCNYYSLVIDPTSLSGNIVNGVYDFSEKYSDCNFTAAKSGYLEVKVSVGDTVMVDGANVLNVNPIEDIPLKAEIVGEYVPGEPATVRVYYTPSDELPSDIYLKYLYAKGSFRFLAPVSREVYPKAYIPGPVYFGYDYLTGQKYIEFNIIPGFGKIIFAAFSKDLNHAGYAQVEFKGVDISYKDLDRDVALSDKVITDGLLYNMGYELSFNGDKYEIGSRVVLSGSEFACSTVYKTMLLNRDGSLYAENMTHSYPVGDAGQFTFVPYLNGVSEGSIYVFVEKDGMIVGEDTIDVKQPTIYVKDVNGEEKVADGSALVGYVNADSKVAIRIERAEGGPVAGAPVSLSKVTGVDVIGYTDANGVFAATIHPLGQGKLEIAIGDTDPLTYDGDIFFKVYYGYALVGYDSSAPVIEIIEPQFTSTDTYEASEMISKVKIVGKVHDAETKVVQVLVNGSPVALIGDQFAAEVNVEPGDNVITVMAKDEVGNVATYRFLVKVPGDTEPPVVSLTVSDLKPASVYDDYVVYETDQNEVYIFGQVSDDVSGVAKVVINGNEVPVVGGRFTYVVKLTGGANNIFVYAVDNAGNVSNTFKVNVNGEDLEVSHITIVQNPYLNKLVIELSPGSQFFKVNGETKSMDVAPFITDTGRTMVPVRFIAEALGLTVDWNAEKRQVTITGEDTQIILTIDSDQAIVNGVPVKLDVAPIILGGRTFVPLRFIAETFGFEVQWQPPVVILIKEL